MNKGRAKDNSMVILQRTKVVKYSLQALSKIGIKKRIQIPTFLALCRQPLILSDVEQQTENWDDDFEDARNSPKKLLNTSPRQRKEGNWDDEMDLEEETEDDSADFGFAEKEEDRTVTARSRQTALQRLSSSSHKPVPPALPTTFLLHRSQLPPMFQISPYPSLPQPFPHRSPNSSVFSVPTTAHAHQTYYSSTTHLRPTSAFALLPPPPPIHKERERRRLRKKSRPKPQGTFELTSLSRIGANASETNIGSSRFAGPSRWNRNRRSFSSDGRRFRG